MFQSLIDIYNTKIVPLLNSSELKGRAARGGLWLGFGSFSDNGGRLIRNMILARILAPEAFGLMAIILAVNMFFESFTQIGLREAVIQNPRGNEPPYLNTAFWLSAGRGTILFIVALIIVPWIAAFYEQPDLIPMMRVAFVGILFFGLISPRAYSELKKMNYRRWVILYHGGSLVGIVTAIILGFYIRNVWALVIGSAVEQLARTILSYIICPFIPSLAIERESLNSLLLFARGMFGIPILVFIYMRADVFVIGKLCTSTELGMYSLANSLVQIPYMLYTSVFHPILLPAFSPHQDDPEKLAGMILKSSRYLALLYIPGLTLAACLASPILTILYTPQYALVSIPFTILCISICLRVLGSVIVSALIALGKPEYTREAAIIRSVLIVVLIYPMVKYMGLIGAAVAGSIAGAVWLLVSLLRLKKNLGLSYYKYVATFFPGLAISAGIIVLWGFMVGIHRIR